MTIEAHGAMEIAAAGREGEPLGTFGILAGLVAMDAVGRWQTVLLRTSFVTPEDARRFPDPDATVAGAWHNVPLTGDAAAALELAAGIASDYDLRPMPPGVLALSLVWNPYSGAARALLEGAEIDQEELFDLLQMELLDVRLEGVVESRPPGRLGRAGRPASKRASEADGEAASNPAAGTPGPLTGVAGERAGPEHGPFAVAAAGVDDPAESAATADPATAARAGVPVPRFTGALGERLSTARLLRRPELRHTAMGLRRGRARPQDLPARVAD